MTVTRQIGLLLAVGVIATASGGQTSPKPTESPAAVEAARSIRSLVKKPTLAVVPLAGRSAERRPVARARRSTAPAAVAANAASIEGEGAPGGKVGGQWSEF